MDEKLILAVYEYPELYNCTLPIYRNMDRKAEAWRKIGALVGLSADEAKRKWKNLRDRYIKEIKVDRTRDGATRAAHKQWRFRPFLEFLKPFVRDSQRRTAEQDYSTTSDEGDDKRRLNLPAPPELKPVPKLEPKQVPKLEPKLEPVAVPQLAHLTQLALVTQLTPLTPPRSVTPSKPGSAPVPGSAPRPTLSPVASSLGPAARRTYRKRKWADGGDLLNDEDELFLLSLAPAMKRLSPQKRCQAKIRMQQIMFEVEFM